MPEPCEIPIDDRKRFAYADPIGERLRQAFVGYDNLPDYVERQPLRLYVYNSRGRLRVGVNEFQTLANRLPMATVNYEARTNAADLCRAQIKHIHLFYALDRHIYPSESIRDDVPEPIFAQATTVRVSVTWEEEWGTPAIFESAENFVDIISRIFGTFVERIEMHSWWLESYYNFEEMYWPHTVKTVVQEDECNDRKPATINDLKHGTFDFTMTPERIVYAKEEICHTDSYDKLRSLGQHLCKFHELLDVSKIKLPRLQGVSQEMQTAVNGVWRPTRIKATIVEGGIWVNWNDVVVGCRHSFLERYGDRWSKFLRNLSEQKRLRYIRMKDKSLE